MQNNMLRKGLVFAVIVLFVGASVVPSLGLIEDSTIGRAILYVGGSGPGNYSTIQSAINDANPGDTVFVYDDSSIYYENIEINKPINLIGENRDTTIIHGYYHDDVIKVYTSGSVLINGFTIMFCGDEMGDYGIDIWYNSIQITISNNIIKNNYAGLKLIGGPNNIQGNIFNTNELEGIRIANSNYNNISNNTITSNGWDGILFWNSHHNTIKNNIIKNNGDGTHNYETGVWLDSSSNNHLEGNLFENNKIMGLRLHDSHGNIIIKNHFISNTQYGLYITEDYSDENQIYHNNFIDNSMNAYDDCSNTWNNNYPSGGNYWDDYFGQDSNGDGIGDTPYNISGGNNQDLYPLMYHFELYYILNITAPSQVNEGTEFNVTVKSMGGTKIPDAVVEFNDESKLTDENGIVYFTAPQVGADTYYDIIATKEGYTEDSETILVKDVSVEFVSTFIFGRIDNLTTVGNVIKFEAVNIRCMTFFPFSFNPYTSGELVTISKDYFGLKGYFGFIGTHFVFALCGASIGG